MLEITPWDLERLTPLEIQERVLAFNNRQRHSHELVAWHLSYLLNLFSKKRITPKDLLEPQEETVVTKEEFLKYMEARRRDKEKSGECRSYNNGG